jgi:hypothetical protein
LTKPSSSSNLVPQGRVIAECSAGMEGREACDCSGIVESLSISFVVTVVVSGAARTWGDRSGVSVNIEDARGMW